MKSHLTMKSARTKGMANPKLVCNFKYEFQFPLFMKTFFYILKHILTYLY